MEITICKADETGGQETAPAEIHIRSKLPAFTTLEATDKQFQVEAELIEDALINSLPGGTYDRLLGLMLARKASHFRVNHT